MSGGDGWRVCKMTTNGKPPKNNPRSTLPRLGT